MVTETPPSGAERRANALRRYPALVWLVAAGLLALLLPSGLTLPQSGPSTLAEYAPVPGAGEGSSDVGELASTQSQGIGSGGRGEGGGARGGDEGVAEDRTNGKLVRKAGTKRCVGNPPRQTEDPSSPPCVAFFDGDNFGATSPGVTRDTIDVTVVMTDYSPALDERPGEVIDCSDPVTPDDPLPDAMCKGYTRFFNDRYQTYNRRVRLWSAHSGVSPADLREKYAPFAHVQRGGTGSMSQNGVLSVGYIGQPRATYHQWAPLMVTYRSDQETQRALFSTYVCDRLVGRPARYAGDPTMRADERKFGLLYSDKTNAERVKAGVKETCGLIFDAESGDYDKPTGIAQLRTEGVTTVVVVVGNTGHVTASNYATQQGWFPEWVITPGSDLNGIDVNFFGRQAAPTQWGNAFGITHDIRRAELEAQPWYRAYKEGCGGESCPEPSMSNGTSVLFAPSLYEAFAMLFYGIQSAGPRLTPENIDRGLHAIPARASDDPFRPAAYFEPGNYSFVKDGMAIWWDPTGQVPGSSTSGCYRLPEEGRRHRPGEWPDGDDLVKGAGPCQGDTFRGG